MPALLKYKLSLSCFLLACASGAFAAEEAFPKQSLKGLRGMIGHTVKFRAAIERFEGPKSATADLDGFWGWDEVLLISPEQGLGVFKEGQDVLIEGEVRSLVTNELNRSLGIVHSGTEPVNRLQDIYISVHKINPAP